ncbi:MAG: aminomethyl-transferring glycine dehydrogenase subunit GcvPA [Thermoguttaceae bacterium]|jgi:glycine dehydrogenase subunit 1
MSYWQNTADDQRAMLDAIGAASLEELFAMVPAELRLGRPLDLPPAMGEMELTAHVAALAARNTPATAAACFLGGGSYDHFIPAAVDSIASRSEVVTSYTPYQPEVSQGNLQALFEYQTLVTQLTGMDVSNSSLYDGGSAAAEAVLMALDGSPRAGHRAKLGRVLVPESVHPEYRRILATYLANLDVELVTLPTPRGTLDPAALEAAIGNDTACVLLEHPNFFGCLEEMAPLSEIVHRAGACLAVAVDPISLGLLKRPGDYGADIVVAEGQSLGIPMAYGGPYLGILACREQFLRRMPGRLVGQTIDRHGRQCWVLTLQTREQHIRREKATSNICTNQALLALRAAVYLATMGPGGLRATAELCLQKARYAAGRLAAAGRFAAAFDRPTFKEFVVRDTRGRLEEFLAAARQAGIFAGIPLGRWYPDLGDCLLVAVTEKRTREEIDRLAGLV